MIQIINNLLLLLSFIIFIASYKYNFRVKECAKFYLLLLISSVLFMFLNFYISKIYLLLLQLALTYLFLKIIFKNRINILDIFGIQFYIFSCKVFNKIIINDIVLNLVIFIITLICFYNRQLINKIYLKTIKLWNQDDEKSLTLRNVFAIIINITFFIINRYL